MNLLSASDAKLAELHNAVVTEIRRRVNASLCDDLSIIRGNEMGKRALLVALAGNHSIVFIGPHNCGKTMFRAAAVQYGIVTFESLPCPCGNFGGLGICNCTDRMIGNYRRKIPVADITVEIVPPAQRDLTGRPGTSSADISKALEELPSYPSLELDENCRNLLKCACAELGIDPAGRERIIAVARTIANLARHQTIQSADMCEAINYRMFRR